jgi:hypothetical protein
VIITFKTTWSTYRVDDEARTFERLPGMNAPTPRVGSGARRYDTISAIEVGRPVLVSWGEHAAVPAADPDDLPCTETSAVYEILLEDPAPAEASS